VCSSTYHFAIVCGRAVVGRVALNGVMRGAFHNAYLGYLVDEACRGRGYATAAVRLVLAFAFESAGLHRVQAAVIPHNTASVRVVQKVGFRAPALRADLRGVAGAYERTLIASPAIRPFRECLGWRLRRRRAEIESEPATGPRALDRRTCVRVEHLFP